MVGANQKPAVGQLARRRPALGALVLADLGQLADPVQLLGGVDRADVGVLVQRVADAAACAIRRLSASSTSSYDRLLHQQPRAGAADVALVEEDAVDDALDGLVDRRVVEDDVRGLAAELEREPSCGCRRPSGRSARPTSVEPVNATLSTSGCSTSARPVSPAPVTMLTTPGGRSACWQISANSSAVSGVVSAGLSTTVLPQASAGAIFHASISSGKFHGMTWPATPSGRGSGPKPGVLELVGPARVVEEVRGDQRDVDVAGLADRLAVVERLQHGELAGALLDDPGDPEQVLRPLAAAASDPRPCRRRRARPRDRRGRRRPAPASATSASTSSVAGLIVLNVLAVGRLDELAVDEQPVRRLEVDDRARLGRRGVLEAASVIGPSSVQREVVGAGVAAGGAASCAASAGR